MGRFPRLFSGAQYNHKCSYKTTHGSRRLVREDVTIAEDGIMQILKEEATRQRM